MALKEKVLIDSIEVNEIGALNIREATVILKDGKELTRSYHRHSLLPGDNLDGQDARVKAVAKAVWTPECLAAYKSLAQKNLESRPSP